MNAPVYGLVLAGGRSTRMRSDKAALSYQGHSQLERAMALLGAQLPRTFVSVRAEQADDPLRARFPRIIDRQQNIGPIAGVLAAQAEHPGSAWLVLACDLPLLDAPTLAHLLAERDPRRVATAYRSSHDGLPEPLCAIYEPASGLSLRPIWPPAGTARASSCWPRMPSSSMSPTRARSTTSTRPRNMPQPCPH
jgi:molybdopterin-guanine dinucleotide biosynthesis protein A